MAVHPTCRAAQPIVLHHDSFEQADVLPRCTTNITPQVAGMCSPEEYGTPELLRVEQAANDSSAWLHVALRSSWRRAIL
jgi:hypothetical protein